MPLNIDKIKEIIGELTDIHIEPLELNESFTDFAARFAEMPGTVVLMSGGDLDCARYHILGAYPWLTFSGRGRHMKLTVNSKANLQFAPHNLKNCATDLYSFDFDADPFDMLHEILTCFHLNTQHSALSTLPIAAGLMGYLSYDLKDCLETLPRTSVDDLQLPHICLFAPSVIVIHDKTDSSTKLCIPQFSKLRLEVPSFKSRVASFKSQVSGHGHQSSSIQNQASGIKSNFTRSDYIAAIEQIKEYIASGHVYQVNMSQRFETDFSGNAFGLFQTLFQVNPAPFFAYINAGDHQIVSTSPERFLLQIGNQVETRPIKGTRPRGKTLLEDEKLKNELKHSKKDDAELSMIVDLLRNDLGKVCKGGSVRVTEHKRLEAYQNVYHLVSVVEGTLDDTYDSADLIKATFPGGSITGCPKIRSMEIIDELEPNRRHIYTGSIGYISFHDTMDLSIAIRTATIYKGKIFFSVGGGIVFDSNPADEYDETLHKGKTLMDVFRCVPKPELGNERRQYVWINGIIKPADEAVIHVSTQGFQFGYGFFETIRVTNGVPAYLEEHIARFNHTWRQLFSQETTPDLTPDLTWHEIIRQVIEKNNLSENVAAVKIIASNADAPGADYDNGLKKHNLIVMARPYIHRLAEKKDPGLHLGTYPHPRYTPLADYKTMNYLYYALAGKWAKEHGFDEALILNPDGTVSETNSANILLIREKIVILPMSPHVLPGIMQDIVCSVLVKSGYIIENSQIKPDELFSADYVMLSNSLMGAVPVLSLDGKKFQTRSQAPHLSFVNGHLQMTIDK